MDANGGATTLALRKSLAARAFARTAAYDAAIAAWFAAQLGEQTPNDHDHCRHGWPRRCATARTRINGPPSTARPSSGSASPPRARCRARSSATTISTTPTRRTSWSPSSMPRQARRWPSSSTPIRAAWRLSQTLAEAYRKALACDPVSAFGGIVAVNRPLDEEAAREIVKIFTEVIIAPDASDEAKAIIAEKKNLRLLLAGGLPDPRAPGVTFRSLAGGFLVQSRDDGGGGRRRAQSGDQAQADQAGAGRSAVRLHRGQARQVERHRLCDGRRHGRHRRRPDVTGRCRAHGGVEGGGGGPRARLEREPDAKARWRRRMRSSRSPTGSRRSPKPAPAR